MNRQRGFVWWIYLIAAGVVVGAVWWGVHSIYSNGYEAGAAKVMNDWTAAVEKQAAAELEQSGQASTKLENDRVQTRTVYRTITKSVDKYIDRPIYRNICFDELGLRDANAALRKAAATDPSKPDAGVPGADGAGKRAGRDGAAKGD